MNNIYLLMRKTVVVIGFLLASAIVANAQSISLSAPQNVCEGAETIVTIYFTNIDVSTLTSAYILGEGQPLPNRVVASGPDYLTLRVKLYSSGQAIATTANQIFVSPEFINVIPLPLLSSASINACAADGGVQVSCSGIPSNHQKGWRLNNGEPISDWLALTTVNIQKPFKGTITVEDLFYSNILSCKSEAAPITVSQTVQSGKVTASPASICPGNTSVLTGEQNVNGALRLNGTVVTTANTLPAESYTGGTISFWLKRDSTNVSSRILRMPLQDNNSTVIGTLDLTVSNDGFLSARMIDSVTAYQFSRNMIAPFRLDNQWHHIEFRFTYNDGVSPIRPYSGFYIDGAKLMTAPYTVPYTPTFGNITFGSSNFYGMIDEFRFFSYDQALSLFENPAYTAYSVLTLDPADVTQPWNTDLYSWPSLYFRFDRLENGFIRNVAFDKLTNPSPFPSPNNIQSSTIALTAGASIQSPASNPLDTWYPSGYFVQGIPGYSWQVSPQNTQSYPVTTLSPVGCNAVSAPVTVEVLPGAPAAPISIDGAPGVCRNSTGNVFSVPPVPNATSYQWTLPTGASGSSTTNSITLAFNNSYVTGNLCVRAVNACGTSAAFCRQVLYLTAVPAQPGNINGNATDICLNTTQTYSVPTVATASSYSWTVPAGAVIVSGQGTNTVSVSFGSTFGNNGVISVRAVNCRGNSTVRNLTVYRIPANAGAITGPSVGVCGGSTYTYSVAPVAGASRYNWTVPLNAQIIGNATGNAISVLFPAGFTTGTISVAAATLCGSSTTVSLALRSVPAQPGVITGPANNLCGTGSFTYSITAVTGATSYVWTVPAGTSISQNNGTSIVLNTTPSFTTGVLSVVAANGCGNSTSRTLSLSRLPAQPSVITGSATVCPSATARVYSVVATTGLTYQWTVPTGVTVVSGQGTATLTVNWGTTSGTLSVRAVNSCGQSTARTLAVSVVACIEEFAGEISQSAGAGDNVDALPTDAATTESADGQALSVNSFGASQDQWKLNAYPNPFSSQWYVKIDHTLHVTMQVWVIDMMGREVFRTQLNTQTPAVMPSDLTSGIYQVWVKDEAGNAQSIKVVRQ